MFKKEIKQVSPQNQHLKYQDSISDSNMIQSCGGHLRRVDTLPEMLTELGNCIHVSATIVEDMLVNKGHPDPSSLSQSQQLSLMSHPRGDPFLQMFLGTSKLTRRSLI